MPGASIPDSSVTDSSSRGPAFMCIPLVITRNPNLSQSAKILYGRLSLYAGKNGACTPSYESLAAEIGVSARYIGVVLRELRSCGLIGWKRRRTSSSFAVNPPEAFNIPVRNKDSEHDRNKSTELVRNKGSDKKMLGKRGSLKDVRDLEGVSPQLQRRTASSATAIKPKAKPAEHERLKRLLACYRNSGKVNPPAAFFPSDSMVAEIFAAAGGRDEDWIIAELRYQHGEQGRVWGSTTGPSSFKWFVAVIRDRAAEADRRDDVSGESKWDHEGLRRTR